MTTTFVFTASLWAVSYEVAAPSVSANLATRGPPVSGKLGGAGVSAAGSSAWAPGGLSTAPAQVTDPALTQVRARLLREPAGVGQLMPALRLQWQR